MLYNNIKLIHGKCENELLNLINDEIKVDLIILDPPYFSTNIKELGDNNWKTINEYIDWFFEVLEMTDKLLKDTGSIYIFHNDISIMVDILYYLKNELKYTIRNNIKCDKFYLDNFSMIIKSYGNNRNYSTTFSEDLFYITKQPDYPLSPFSKILSKALLTHKRKNIAALLPSKNGKITNWLQNHLTGRAIPTITQWDTISNFLNIKNDYESLIDEYNNSRYCFNQDNVSFKNKSINEQKNMLQKYSEIYKIELCDKDIISNFKFNKPYNLIKDIVNTSSNIGDTVLDFTMGSGTTGLVCKDLNRNFIGIESNIETFKIAQQRINI